MYKKITLLLIGFFLTGCASMTNSSHQNITIATTNNQHYNETRCSLENEEGKWSASPDAAVMIHRDGNTMNVSCQNNSQFGEISVSPEFEGSYLFLDLLLDLCIVSCVVDGVNNAFYDYPSFVSVHLQELNNQ
ncbi:MAG: hypothetical protein HOF75_08005 [Flavobacteriaceae bacterium]|jgi:hypothetical protein|nr:hypothetical protein [Flavobacteriaceae bacterium]